VGDDVNKRILQSLGLISSTATRARMKGMIIFFRNLLDSIAIKLDIPPLAAEREGIHWRGFLRHRSFLEGLSTGKYEPQTIKIFQGVMDRADVFVDVGAHIGLYSVLAARKGKPDMEIFAVEADPYNAQALRYNLRKNRSSNAHVIEAAASGADGLAPMLISESTIGSSLVIGRRNIGPAFIREMKTIALDTVLPPVSGERLLVKIDVEGAEISVLHGMARTIRRASRVALICEINPSALHAGDHQPVDLIRQLRAFDLRLYFISDVDGGLIAVEESFWAKGNLFGVRNWPIPLDWLRPV
jgi:FkbM family methyltransferase